MNNSSVPDRALLQGFTTERLETLLPALLKELRHRDSKHMKRDAITTSRSLRALRKTDRIP